MKKKCLLLIVMCLTSLLVLVGCRKIRYVYYKSGSFRSPFNYSNEHFDKLELVIPEGSTINSKTIETDEVIEYYVYATKGDDLSLIKLYDMSLVCRKDGYSIIEGTFKVTLDKEYTDIFALIAFPLDHFGFDEFYYKYDTGYTLVFYGEFSNIIDLVDLVDYKPIQIEESTYISDYIFDIDYINHMELTITKAPQGESGPSYLYSNNDESYYKLDLIGITDGDDIVFNINSIVNNSCDSNGHKVNISYTFNGIDYNNDIELLSYEYSNYSNSNHNNYYYIEVESLFGIELNKKYSFFNKKKQPLTMGSFKTENVDNNDVEMHITKVDDNQEYTIYNPCDNTKYLITLILIRADGSRYLVEFDKMYYCFDKNCIQFHGSCSYMNGDTRVNKYIYITFNDSFYNDIIMVALFDRKYERNQTDNHMKEWWIQSKHRINVYYIKEGTHD